MSYNLKKNHVFKIDVCCCLYRRAPQACLSRLNPINILTLSFNYTIFMLYLSQSLHFRNFECTVTGSKELFSSFLLNVRTSGVSSHLVTAMCKLWNYSHICGFLSSTVTWCLLGQGIFHTSQAMFCLKNEDASFTPITGESRTETYRFGQDIECVGVRWLAIGLSL